LRKSAGSNRLERLEFLALCVFFSKMLKLHTKTLNQNMNGCKMWLAAASSAPAATACMMGSLMLMLPLLLSLLLTAAASVCFLD
jgi:hypothetical protein